MERLNKLGIKTLCYHAGLKTHERLDFQDKWQNGDVPVICATISFGMGVDKSTVRHVYILLKKFLLLIFAAF